MKPRFLRQIRNFIKNQKGFIRSGVVSNCLRQIARCLNANVFMIEVQKKKSGAGKSLSVIERIRNLPLGPGAEMYMSQS